MGQFLKFHNEQDYTDLMARCEHRTYEADEVLLDEGEHHRAIFVIREGHVRIERSHGGFDLAVASIGPGEIFGEMSFVEDNPASARVVADEPVKVDIIEAEHVKSLVQKDLGFYGRFYRSVAAILSRRLRETTERGISDYSWGGNEAAGTDEPETAGSGGDAWGGGSPFQREP